MIDNIVNIIKGPIVVKSIDPTYNEAKAALKRITFDSEKMITYIENMEKSLQKLDKATFKLGDDIERWFSDAPNNEQLEAITNFSFTKHFSALTNNFLIPRAEKHVISLFNNYKQELDKIRELREKVKKARKQFDKSQAMVKYLSSFPDPDTVKIGEAIEKMDIANSEYSTLNFEFISAVNNVENEWKEKLEKPFKNLLCITSQYMMQVFVEIQKYRTTFPSDLFNITESQNKNPIEEDNSNKNESTGKDNFNESIKKGEDQ